MKLPLKQLTYLFSATVAGIALCLVMSIVTAVREKRAVTQAAPVSIPTPAY